MFKGGIQGDLIVLNNTTNFIIIDGKYKFFGVRLVLKDSNQNSISNLDGASVKILTKLHDADDYQESDKNIVPILKANSLGVIVADSSVASAVLGYGAGIEFQVKLILENATPNTNVSLRIAVS